MGSEEAGGGGLGTLSGNLAVGKQDGETLIEKHGKNTHFRAHLAGSVSRACNSRSQDCESGPHVESRDYLKK